jgi:hypothetical protein
VCEKPNRQMTGWNRTSGLSRPNHSRHSCDCSPRPRCSHHSRIGPLKRADHSCQLRRPAGALRSSNRLALPFTLPGSLMGRSPYRSVPFVGSDSRGASSVSRRRIFRSPLLSHRRCSPMLFCVALGWPSFPVRAVCGCPAKVLCDCLPTNV